MSATIISLDHYRQVRDAREADAAAAETQAQRLGDRRTRLGALIRALLRPASQPIPFPGAPLLLVVVPFTPRPGPGAA